MTPFSPDQAHRDLDEASARARVAGADSRAGAAYTAALGAVVAGTLVAVSLWRTNPAGVAISMGVYGAVLAGLLLWRQRRVRITTRGWGRTYLYGFGLTMALYVAGICWESLAFPGWAVFAPYCALVAVPSLVSAARMRWAGMWRS